MQRVIRAGFRLINPAQIIEVQVSPEQPERTYFDEEEGVQRTSRFVPVEVTIITTGVSGEEYGYDEIGYVLPKPYEIRLRGGEACEFLDEYVEGSNASFAEMVWEEKDRKIMEEA